MPFRKLTQENRKIQLVSLIDLIFILLIFFIITSVLIRLTKGESKLFIPTPKNEAGEAQIFIQMLDEYNSLWIDHTAIDTLNLYTYKLNTPVNNEKKVNILLEKMTLNETELNLRIDKLKRESRKYPGKEYFVIIRCPEELPYNLSMNIFEKFIDTPNIEYGCLAGSIDDVLNESNILVKGNVIQIDFQKSSEL